MLTRKQDENKDVISTDIKHLQDNKAIVKNVEYTEINQEKNCQDIKAKWMLLTQTTLL